MKKLFLSILFLLSLVVSFAQTPIVRSSNANTVYDTRLGALKNFIPPTYADTTEANLSGNIGLDSVGALIFTFNTNSYWYRADNPKRWVPVGITNVTTENSNTILFNGFGTESDPLIANVLVSSQADNIVQVLSDGIYVKNQLQNGVIRGGLRTWVSGYTYDVTEVLYVIKGVPYLAPETQITLANADPTLDRLDLIVANDDNTITVITGTPAVDPAVPSYDPETQVSLGFVLVTANTTEPTPTPEQENIYINNTEWTTSSSTPRINAASVNNPFSPALVIEFTDARNNDSITFTDPSPPADMDNFQFLTFKIRSKAAWPATARIELRFYYQGAAVGVPLSMGNGHFGFNSSNTTGYQTLTIQKEIFGNLANVDLLFLTVRTQGGQTIGAYVDDIKLQGGTGTGTPTTGNFWTVGGNLLSSPLIGGTLDNNYVQLIANNLSHTQLMTNGSTWMQGTNPGISFFLGSFSTADYFIRRNGTDLITQSAGSITNKISGNNIYTYNNTDGHLWYAPAGTPVMELDLSGNLNLGSTIGNASTIFNVVSTTKGSHPAPTMTSTQMNLIASPLQFDLVGNSTAGLFYYYNGSAWVPLGSTALSSLTAGVATNTINSGTFAQEWQWNSLAGNSALKLSSSSTFAIGNAQRLFEVSLSGANSNASQTTYAGYFSNTHTGTGVNFGIYSVASGITGPNYGVWGEGTNVGVYGFSAATFGIGTIGNANNPSGAGGQFFNDHPTGTGLRAYSSGGLSLEARMTTADPGAVGLVASFINSQTSGAALNGIGSKINFRSATTTQSSTESNAIISSWVNATHASRTSQFSITGINSAATVTVLTLDADGTLTLGAEYQGLGAGYLAVSNTGVVSWASATGSMTNPMTATGSIIYSSDGSGTPAELLIGDPGEALVVNGAGDGYEFVALVGAGTVTDIDLSGSDFTFSGGPVTTTGTINITLATVNANVGSFGSSTAIPSFTVNEKGLITAASTNAVIAPAGTLTGTILASNVVTSSLTQVGTIATGVWNGTAIGATFGGTGLSSYATGDILYASGVNTLSKRAAGTNGYVLTMSGGVPTWQPATSGGTVFLVQGVLNRTTVINGSTNPTIDISANYVGQTSITVLGNITTGTWNGTTIALNKGGTGLTSGGTALQQLRMNSGATALEYFTPFNSTWQTLTDGATVNWNVNNGGNAQLTLAGTGRTLVIQNPQDGHTYTLRVIQGSGGLKTISVWPSGSKWPGGTVVDLSDAAGAYDMVSFKYQASTSSFYVAYGNNYQ